MKTVLAVFALPVFKNVQNVITDFASGLFTKVLGFFTVTSKGDFTVLEVGFVQSPQILPNIIPGQDI